MGGALASGIGTELSSTVLTGSLLAAIPIALLAGLVSFASPCVVPLVPGYLGYVSGMAGADAGGKASRPRLILGVLLFILGFSAVFVTLSIVVSTAGAEFRAQLDIITRVLGVLVILMGLAFMGAVPFLQNERRLHISPKAGLAGAPVLGVVFGLGWAPCIGPTLSAVLALGLNEGTVLRGSILAVVYCLGLGLPFLALAIWFERSGTILRWLRKHRRGLQLFGGAMLVVLGVMLVTGLWGQLTALLQGWIDGFWVAV
ncbi:cytochrome c biogenesis CcdA family protein [Demequina activiva]|uniref:Cytochrome C biogenesis protein CcdA n=1 Tax=Demequina activiva TaxID=1582364 RepID=A0A919Q2B3_9MICO|nr:cytochrome c biogenesis protein CcdA [Demequina activiva]GIG54922.1 cytochrome C biogenesis protein CcdA [Demequina activiva]